MSAADVMAPLPLPSVTSEPNVAAVTINLDVVKPDAARTRERFIPVTTFALIDRLTLPHAWPAREAKAARRFFRYLDYWRRQQHNAALMELLQAYEPFSPDSDLLVTRRFTADERLTVQKRVVSGIESILLQANYVRIDPKDVAMILTKESHYGLDLHVDFTAFEEVLIYYRGASNRRDQRRTLRKFMRKEEFDVPIFQRLFLLFKLKGFDARVQEIMKEQKLSRREAEKLVTRMRSLFPPAVNEDNIYLKLFKNIPRSDVEMVFPNTKVKFRLFDKLRLGTYRRRRPRHGRLRSRRQDCGCRLEPDYGSGRRCRPRRHCFPPGRQLHEPEAALHGRHGAEPLFPFHGRQSRRADQAR